MFVKSGEIPYDKGWIFHLFFSNDFVTKKKTWMQTMNDLPINRLY